MLHHTGFYLWFKVSESSEKVSEQSSYWISSWFMGKRDFIPPYSPVPLIHMEEVEFWLNYSMLNFLLFSAFSLRCSNTYILVCHYFEVCHLFDLWSLLERVCTMHIHTCTAPVHWNSSIYEITSIIPSVQFACIVSFGKVNRKKSTNENN